MNNHAIGDVTREYIEGAAVIKQRVSWVAYARNGNVGHETVTYTYDVFVDGKLFAPSIRTLREAKAIARNGE